MQQKEVLSGLLDLEVGMLVGSMGIDSWDARRWAAELAASQVLVMPYGVLYNILSSGHLKVLPHQLVPCLEAATSMAPTVVAPIPHTTHHSCPSTCS